MHVLIDMRTFQIVYMHEDEEKVDEAKNLAAPPTYATSVPGGWDGFGGPDLMRFWNALPGVEPVKRFETRAAGIRRIEAKLAEWKGIPPYARSAAPVDRKPPARAPKPVSNGSTIAVTAVGKKGEALRFQAGSTRSKVFDVIKAAETIGVEELVRRCASFANKGQVLGCVQKLSSVNYVKFT